MTCIGCCGALLATTKPRTVQAIAMLAVIERCIVRNRSDFSPEQVRQMATSLAAARKKPAAAA
jgi:hypothetical protein